jgi:hypothetical protein
LGFDLLEGGALPLRLAMYGSCFSCEFYSYKYHECHKNPPIAGTDGVAKWPSLQNDRTWDWCGGFAFTKSRARWETRKERVSLFAQEHGETEATKEQLAYCDEVLASGRVG